MTPVVQEIQNSGEPGPHALPVRSLLLGKLQRESYLRPFQLTCLTLGLVR